MMPKNPCRSLLAAAIAVISLGVAQYALADEIAVPGDVPTIAEAIEAASSGDFIVIAAGDYELSSPLELSDKRLFFVGTRVDDQLATRLIGGGTSKIFRIDSDPTLRISLRDLVLTDGGGTNTGGLVQLVNGYVEFLDCRFTNGISNTKGGAVLVENSASAQFTGCSFADNEAFVGGAIFADDSSAVFLTDCDLRDNAVVGTGGAIYANGGSTVLLSGCTVCGNTPNQIYGPYTASPSSPSEITDVCADDCDGVDSDGDGTEDCFDGCPDDPDKTAPGDCGCGTPDTDTDSDGTPDCFDGCPDDPDKTAPGDCGCGTPETDTDSDGTPDCLDGCPDDPDKTAPGDCGCGTPDADTDSDGTPDCLDGCPDDPDKTAPGDCGCGTPETDSDGDGVADCVDGCPDNPDKTAPGECGCDVDGVDSDADGTPDCLDSCPNDPDKIEPGDCGCGNPETDSDGDGVADCIDGCPEDSEKSEPGACGCGTPDLDSDGDGTLDCIDGCPQDPDKIESGECGCGTPDTDTDLDGTLDCFDGCPNDPNKIEAGDCGCGVADIDTDQDGAPDCVDECPEDPEKFLVGECGCGVADIDSDTDGTADCIDGCPEDPEKVEPGDCGCGVVETDSDGDGTPDCLDDLIDVPNDFQTVAEAIAAAPAGFRIQVAPGTYNESFDFAGKILTIEGDPDAPNTVIFDGTGLAGPIVVADSNESAGSVLRGVTLRNGIAGGELPDSELRGGGAIFIRNASPTIELCRFESNLADLGGAVICIASDSVFRDCSFSQNTALDAGGAAYMVGATSARLEGCILEMNMTNGSGGGIALIEGNLEVIDSEIRTNAAGIDGGGILAASSSILSLASTIVCENAPDEIEGDYQDLGDNEICSSSPCPPDLNGDGVVDGSDLGQVFLAWGICPAPCGADFDANGVVDGGDLGQVFLFWGPCP